jgi:hypothetical protein
LRCGEIPHGQDVPGSESPIRKRELHQTVARTRAPPCASLFRVHTVEPEGLPIRGSVAYISDMNLQLSDEQAVILAKELRDLIDGDRYFLSPRVRTLQQILDMIRPPPVREPLPPLRDYEPPSRGRYTQRR